MSDILNAAEVRSGTWGELRLDGEQVAECYGCQIKVNKTKDDVTRCRTLVAGKKMTAVSITGTIRDQSSDQAGSGGPEAGQGSAPHHHQQPG